MRSGMVTDGWTASVAVDVEGLCANPSSSQIQPAVVNSLTVSVRQALYLTSVISAMYRS